MIRLFFAALFLIIFLIVSLPIQLVLWLLWKAGIKDSSEIASLRIVQWAFKVLIFVCGIKTTVIGEENIPSDQAVLYVGNHNSYFDIVLTYARVERRTGYIAKKEMLRYPSLRVWMKFLHCLFLDRKDLKAGMKMILDAISMIKNGISVFIFPEGTRNTAHNELEMLPFKEGSLKIAEKSGCLIIPVAMTGTADIFENHFPSIKSSRVILEYGCPIDPSSLSVDDKKHIGAYVQGQILAMLKKHKNLA